MLSNMKIDPMGWPCWCQVTTFSLVIRNLATGLLCIPKCRVSLRLSCFESSLKHKSYSKGLFGITVN